MVNNNFIDKNQAKTLKCNTGVFPKMYFTPKIHKPNLPLRPIVSFIGSPIYNLSKYVSNLLNFAFLKDEKYVKNSFEFVDFIKTQTIPDNHMLVSLDVISLFTNIPIDLTNNIIKDRWHLIEINTTITLDMFLELFTFCIENNYFNFNGEFFKQIYGLGMGNCMSPICSDLVMSQLQEVCLNKLSFQVPIFKRYVDDIFLVIPKDTETELLKVFNSFHEKLKFTIEIENNNKIAFLDTEIIRTSENKLLIDWYHKPTFSERFLNFNSHHSMKTKLNIINNLKYRATQLSSPEFKEKNLQLIKKYLNKNNYPISLINRILHINNSNNLPARPLRSEQNYFYKIPYVRQLSEKIKQTLTSENINIAFKSENTIKKKFFTKLKSRTPIDLQSNVIYQIPCKNCDKSYIGQTGRYLNTRKKEHIRDVKNKNKINITSLVEHCKDFDHEFNFEETKIIGRQNNLEKRKFQEMINIKKSKSVNSRKDIENLNSCYFNLINKIDNL